MKVLLKGFLEVEEGMSDLSNLIYRRSVWANHYVESVMRRNIFRTMAKYCVMFAAVYAIYHWRVELVRMVDILLPALNL